MPVDDTAIDDMVAKKQKQRQGLLLNAKKELAKADAVLATDPVDPRALQVSLMKLRDYQKRIQDYTQSIQDTLKGVALDSDIEKMSEFDDTLLEMLCRLDATSEALKEEAVLARSIATSMSAAHDLSHSSTADSSRIRLPKIELRSYNGDPLKWDEFWDYYDNTFHSNAEIPVIEKFTYLRSLLEGEALRLVEGYRLTAANYEEVIKALKERFGDPEVAIFQHFDAMLSMPVSSGDVSDLQRAFDICEAHIRSLIALGLTEETFGRVFAPILLSKLPGNVRVELIRKKGRGAWSLAKLREHLRDELYARDMSKRSFGNQSGSKPSSSDSRHPNFGSSHPKSAGSFKRQQFSTSALPNAGRSNGGRKQPKCVFCGDFHYSNSCAAYTSAESRRQKLKGCCYICFDKSHMARDCTKKKPCFFCRESSHHQSLCPQKFPSSRSGDCRTTQLNVAGANREKPGEKSITSSVMSHNGQRGVLQTAVADVSGTARTASARLMLDNGSDNSFISNQLAKRLGARCIGSEVVSLAGFADNKRRQSSYKVYEFDVRLRNGKTLSVKAYGTDVIICSIDKLAFDVEKYPVLACLPLAEPLSEANEHVNVDVLIGSDYYYEIVKAERIPLSDGLVLLGSELGYVVAGRVNASTNTAATMLLSRSPMPETNFDIERFWKLEEIGIKEPVETSDDEVALSKFNDTVKFDDIERRYMVKWPFKSDHPPLPDNFGLAFGRLKSLLSRASASNHFVEKCQAIFDDQIAKGIIEEAPPVQDGVLHYLPHHAVVTPDKTTTKVRVVYDASSKTNRQQPSLNDCVYRGPVMLESLCGLLIRFRLKPIGVTSDIEKAFLQIGLQKEDRDVTRFLWLRDPTKSCTKDNLVHYRFRRVCFGVIASPFLLAATLTYHLKKVATPVADQILSNLYVDNVIDSKSSTDSAMLYYNEAKRIFDDASMNLREWHSNDPKFMAAIRETDRGSQTRVKVLGLLWDLAADTLSCPYSGSQQASVVTKRVVLRTIAEVYDPCGFLTPVTAPAKWLMQELWQEKYDWDTPLSEELVHRWTNIYSNLEKLSGCVIPRCYALNALESAGVELHAFCDASAKAYCAVIFIVPKLGDRMSPMEASLVFSKCRVSPLKQQSIPRLELLAATVGARLLQFVANELRLPVVSKTLWSDSQCCLHWITGKPVSTVFVRNRVAEIRKTDGVEFRFVPTADNPADLPTRGMNTADLKSCSLWWHGPPWLANREHWPENPVGFSCPSEEAKFVAAMSDPVPEHVVLAAAIDEDIPYLFDITRVAKLSKLLRVTAWVLRFVRKTREATKKRNRMKLRSRGDHAAPGYSSPYLSAVELQSAKVFWERAVQKRHFPNIVASDGRNSDSFKSLGPVFLNCDGVICCQSRLANADVSDSAKSPKLLPKGDTFTRLVIAHYHESFNHAGVKQTLGELRCEYWVVHGRSEVKRTISKCLLCRRQKGGPFGVPPAPDLPDFRVTKSQPFAVVGLDYLGPLIIFGNDGSQQKVWLGLFTCAVTRAVHLEVASQMDSANFLLAFRRFMSFCGCPNLVVSDNAGQFDLSRRVLHKLWHEACQSSDVQNFSAANGISWKFIPESAPWMGGFYERLVGVVKSSLKAAIDRRNLNLVELQTVVYEAAAVVNSRPLIYSEDEVGDIPLTPAHLIMRHRTIVPFVSIGEPLDSLSSTQHKLMAGWKRLSSLLDVFWSVWSKEYLLSLRERCQSSRQRNVVRVAPSVGEVVLVQDKTLPRAQWRVGRIEELILSADGRVRSAKVRLPKKKLMTRPIKQLFPLEIRDPLPS